MWWCSGSSYIRLTLRILLKPWFTLISDTNKRGIFFLLWLPTHSLLCFLFPSPSHLSCYFPFHSVSRFPGTQVCHHRHHHHDQNQQKQQEKYLLHGDLDDHRSPGILAEGSHPPLPLRPKSRLCLWLDLYGPLVVPVITVSMIGQHTSSYLDDDHNDQWKQRV